MFKLLKEVRRTKIDSKMHRFLGFKSTGGQDQFPHPLFSVTHLFEPSNNSYSSEALSEPAIAQGVFLPQSISDHICEDRDFRIYLNRTMEHHLRLQDIYKIDPRQVHEWEGLCKDEQLVSIIHIAVEFLCLFSRMNRQDSRADITQQAIDNIPERYREQWRVYYQQMRKLAQEQVEVYSPANIIVKFLEICNRIKRKLLMIYDETELNQGEFQNREKMLQIRGAGVQNYIELRHEA